MTYLTKAHCITIRLKSAAEGSGSCLFPQSYDTYNCTRCQNSKAFLWNQVVHIQWVLISP